MRPAVTRLTIPRLKTGILKDNKENLSDLVIHGTCGHIPFGSEAHRCSNRNAVLGGRTNTSIYAKSKGSTRRETVKHYLYNLKSILSPTPPQVLYHTTRIHQRHRQLVAGHCGTCLAFGCSEDISQTKTRRVFAARVFFRHPDAELTLSMYYTSSYQNHHQSQSLPRSQGDSLLDPTIHFPPQDPPQTSLLRGRCWLPALE